MSLEHLDKEPHQRIQQLALIIHNCRIYGNKVKQEWIDEYNKLEELTKE